jgi:phenylpropionate dioxygenase-like ring-hydroxylating dioxygenase large terminal subunit
MDVLKNAWYIGAWSHEITDAPLARTILNAPVVFFRDESGNVAALLDRCCHRGAALSLGRVIPTGIQCGYHGMVFNGAGKCVEVPGQPKIPAKACVKSFVVHEKDQFVWLWFGDPEAADASQILDYPYHDDSDNWPHRQGMLHVKGNYSLVMDNLMDLTHLAYVHKQTIGSGDANPHVGAIMNTERTRTGVKYVRWMLDVQPPSTYTRAVTFRGNVDRWQEFEFIAPGGFIQFSGATNANTGAYDQGIREGGFSLRVFHGITPETDKTCHYFYSTAHAYRRDDPAATDQLFDEITKTFREDKVFIEMQQTRMDQFPEPPLLDIISDGARVAARRHMEVRLKQQEQSDACGGCDVLSEAKTGVDEPVHH